MRAPRDESSTPDPFTDYKSEEIDLSPSRRRNQAFASVSVITALKKETISLSFLALETFYIVCFFYNNCLAVLFLKPGAIPRLY